MKSCAIILSLVNHDQKRLIRHCEHRKKQKYKIKTYRANLALNLIDHVRAIILSKRLSADVNHNPKRVNENKDKNMDFHV